MNPVLVATLVVISSIISSVILYVVLHIIYRGLDVRSYLVAAFLMTLVGCMEFLQLPRYVLSSIIFVIDYFILSKQLDCSGYTGLLGAATWVMTQILFYQYLSGPLQNALFS